MLALVAVVCAVLVVSVMGRRMPAPLLTLDRPENVISGEYLVKMKTRESMDSLDTLLLGVSSRKMETQKHSIGEDFHLLFVKCDKKMLASILNMEDVEYVEPNQKMWAFQDQCQVQTNDVPWGISRITHDTPDHNDEFPFKSNYGANVNMYIIDTGVFCAHQDFEDRCEWGTNTVDNSDSDGNGHGTHVASTAGGVRYGIAVMAKIIAVKVLTASGSGTTNSVIGGIEYSSQQHQARGGPSVANMSLGGGRSTALNSAVDASTTVGVIHVVAAGNSNNDANNQSPASADTAVTVGSTTLDGFGGNREDGRSSFSSYGAKLVAWAPGSDIKGAWIGSPTATRTISGTSMASPHVCGVASVFASDNNGVSRDDVYNHIRSEADEGIINLKCSNSACNASPNLLLSLPCS